LQDYFAIQSEVLVSELQRALGEIRDIRRQVALSTEFRGYGPLTMCATGAFAVVGGLVQAAWVGQPEVHPLRYTTVWSVTAILSVLLIAAQTLTRTHSAMADEMIRMAAEQFLPAAAAGTLLTILVIRSSAHIIWLLPGLWQIVYGLGVFSSCRFLSRTMLAAGAWYLLTGLFCVSLGDARALSPAVMAGAYGIGQLLVGGVLYVAAKEGCDDEEAG
jgi:hypothetical protein